MRESSRETWASSLSGETSPEGFLSLSANTPLVLAGSGASPPVNLGFESPNGTIDITLFQCSPNEIIEDETQSITWCHQSGKMLVAIHSTDGEFRNAVRASLTISDIRESPWGTPEDPSETTTTTLAAQVPAEGPVFGEETGMVLLLDDGLEGLIAVDPDARRFASSPVEGQRAGDEEFSMVKVGERLVVGWANIHVVDIATRQGFSLGSATVFVPSAVDDNVWMVDYPGGSIGSGRPSVWQVNTTGETTIAPRELNSDLIPVFGTDGGLALQSDLGIELWDVATGEVRDLAGDGPGFAHDVSGDTLAWCGGNCSTLNLTNTSSLITEELPAPAGMVFLDSGFSDDGRYLAAILADDFSFQGEAILLLDRETGMETKLSGEGAPVDFMGWAPDNDQLFATGYSYGRGVTPIWHYRISTGELTTAVIPVGGAITPVVIEGSLADEYFTSDVEDF
jgi:WD40 repeat protein